MINGIKEVAISKYVKLHMIKSRKFKTDLIGIYIKRPLTYEEATKNTLLTRIMDRATKKYPTSKEFAIKLEEMYGSVIYSDVSKYGEKQVLQFKIQMPNKKHISDKNIFINGLNILDEVINNPLVENGEFSREYFDNEVNNLKDEILGRVNDKMTYAIDRCIEEMCVDEPYSTYEYGSIEELNKITPKSLYEYYKEVISGSEIDICVIGDIDFNEIENNILNNFKVLVKNVVEYPKVIIEKEVSETRFFEEKFNINQGKLTLGYRTNLAFSNHLYEASVLFSSILGGGANSKLFKNIREKESLCYYIFAKTDKFKGLMLIGSGIEFENYEKVLELIDREFKDMINGNFTDEDIKIAKDSIISSLNSISDYENSFMNYYYANLFTGNSFDIENRKKMISNVTREEIIEAGEKIVKDTVYFLNRESK